MDPNITMVIMTAEFSLSQNFLGQGRVHVYFEKAHTFTFLNSSEISVRG